MTNRRRQQLTTPGPNNPCIVVSFRRVSTEDQAKRGKSLPEQLMLNRAKAEELARSHNAPLEFYDFEDHHGGDLLERPTLEEVRKFVREVRPHYFVCLDPDRFSRSLKLQLIVADEIEAVGTRLVFIQQDYDPDDMMSRAFFQFRGLMAELDKAKILDRTYRGKKQALRNGEIPNGVLIFGYDYDPNRNNLVINETEAKWVRLMFRWVLEEDLGPERIARRLQELGVPTKRGGRWHRGVVADILRNPTYIGTMRANRTDFRGYDAQRRLPPDRRDPDITPRLKDESEWILVPVPAILDVDTFMAVQDARRRFKRLTHAKRGRHILSGLAVCGLCGAPMNYCNSKIGYLLRCARRYPTRENDTPCEMPHVKAEPIEQQTLRTIEEWLVSDEALEAYVADRRRRQRAPAAKADMIQAEITALQDQIEQKKAAQRSVLALVRRGRVHPDVAEAELDELQRELAALETRIQDLARRQESWRSEEQSMDRLVRSVAEMREQLKGATAAQIRQRLAALSPEQTQALVRRLISRVVVYRDRTCDPVGFGL